MTYPVNIFCDAVGHAGSFGSLHERTENPWGPCFLFLKKGRRARSKLHIFFAQRSQKRKKKVAKKKTMNIHEPLWFNNKSCWKSSQSCNAILVDGVISRPSYKLSQDKSGKTQILGLQGARGFPKQTGFLYSWLVNGSTRRCMASFRWFALKHGSWYKTKTPETIGEHSKSGMIQQKDLLLCTCFKSAHLSLGNEQNHNQQQTNPKP